MLLHRTNTPKKSAAVSGITSFIKFALAPSMTDALLILNAGSSSLKFSVFRDCRTAGAIAARPVGRIAIGAAIYRPRCVVANCWMSNAWPAGSTLSHQQAIEFLFDWGQRLRNGGLHLVAAGHRVVHGGTKFLQPARVDEELLARFGVACAIGAAASATQSRGDSSCYATCADDATGCLLRHVVSSDSAPGRPAVCLTA